ncbi:MAG: MSHA biogenesis protein MshQ [Alteromonadaceae bacterium]|jgi:MSHA biogenesis protein MshQ
MAWRIIFTFLLSLLSCFNLYAAQCLNVFPDEIETFLSAENQLINFPSNTSSAHLTNGTTLPRGDNFYLDDILGNKGKVFVGAVTGSETTARLFFRGGVNWSNVKINEAGKPEDLIIIIDGGFAITGVETVINAIIYAKGANSINGAVTINGAISSHADISLSGEAPNLNYQTSYINNADFKNMCIGAPESVLDAYYRFDECAYEGSNNEVIDQVGNYSANSFNSVNTFSAGKIERAADINHYSHHFETSIPITSSFSISTWFKKPTSTNNSQYFILGSMAAGGDLLYLDRNNGWRWGVYSVADGYLNGSYSFSSLDSNWHHLALVFNNGVTKLYIDGIYVDSVNRVPVGTLKYIATSYDSVGTNNAQGFRAPLDEFMVYSGALSATDISTIYTNQANGKNHDGTTRAEVNCAVAIANYRFDECTYNGNNDVADQFGNYSASSFNSVNTFGTGKIERAADINHYSHHFETSIPITSPFSISTWFKKPTSTSNSRYFILGSMAAGGDLLYLDRNNGWRWGVYSVADGSLNGSYSFSSLDSNWHHLALVFNNGVTKLYIDGIYVDSVNRVPIGTLKYIATSYDSVGTNNAQGFRAPLDEFIVYSGALSATDISTVYTNQGSGKNHDGTIRAAVKCLNHFEILHDGNGLTCDPETVTIKACTNVHGGTCNESTDVVSLNFKVAGDFKKSLSFTRKISFAFNHTTAGSAVTLSIDNPSITPTNSTVCINSGGSNNSCDMDFADAGFIFDVDNITNKISTTSCEASSVITIRAVQKNLTSNKCDPSFKNVSKSVKFWTKYWNPEEGGQKTTLTYNAADYLLAKSEGTPIDVAFNANSEADFTINYPDAGQLYLHASHDGSGADTDLRMTGSKDFVSVPAKLIIASADTNAECIEGNATCLAFKKAGEDFNLSITAVCDDINNTITPNFEMDNIELTVNTVAPALGNTVSLGVIPVAITNSTANGHVPDNGKEEIIQTISEVGVFKITAKPTKKYFTFYDGPSGTSENIGRFIPAYFQQTIEKDNKGDLVANHGAGCLSENWVYSGQETANKGSIRYGTLDEPILTITAYNSTANITKNYAGDFAKLSNLTIAPKSIISFGTPNATHLSNNLQLTGDVSTLGSITAIGNGVLEYKLSSGHHFTYTRSASSVVAAFNSAFEIPITSIADSDSVAIRATDTSTTPDTEFFVNPLFSETTPNGSGIIDNSIDIRFGRWFVENNFGPETEDLSMPMYAQYYNGTSFVTNTYDSCTIPTLLLPQGTDKVENGAIWSGGLTTGKYRLTDLDMIDTLGTDDIDATVIGRFVDGKFTDIANKFIFSAPNGNKQGALEFEYEVPDWFKFKWNNIDENGDLNFYDDNPTAVATFGLYRGNDRIILWREVGN